MTRLLRGDELKRAVRRFQEEMRKRLEGEQEGVPTFCDAAVTELVRVLEDLGGAEPWEETVQRVEGDLRDRFIAGLGVLQRCISRRSPERFLPFADRGPVPESDVDPFTMVMSQGVERPLTWRGRPLFKTVFDFALYPMILHELQPRTVIELGSGTGASALWLADLMQLFGTEGHVWSVDIHPPRLERSGVTFLRGDTRRIEETLDPVWLQRAPHPWLLLEDAHVEVDRVLSYFHTALRPGDCVIVEDTERQRDVVAAFLAGHADAYRVDTRYTDYFGRNATCAPDSIWVRTAENGEAS